MKTAFLFFLALSDSPLLSPRAFASDADLIYATHSASHGPRFALEAEQIEKVLSASFAGTFYLRGSVTAPQLIRVNM